MNDEQLNAILHKADDDLDRLKDKCHDLYEENVGLKARIDKAIEYLQYTTTFRYQDLLNILQNGSEE